MVLQKGKNIHIRENKAEEICQQINTEQRNTEQENSAEKNPLKRKIIKKLWFLLIYPLCIIIMAAVKKSSYIAEEIFAKRIFKVFSQIMSLISGIFPFSVAELCIVSGPALLTVLFIYWVVRVFKRGKKKRLIGYLNGFVNILIGLGIALFVFIIGCGVNYYRYPVNYYLGFEVREYTTDELFSLCSELAVRAGEARSRLNDHENEDGVFELNISMGELGKYAKEAYSKVSEEYAIFGGFYAKPKAVHFSRVLSSMEITGIFIPFTMEANVNIDIPDYSIGSTMCHELAHLHGFIREDEANYISYFICTNSGNEILNYSGLMEALIIAGNALYAQDKDKYYEVRALYDDGVVRDLYANSLYWKEFEDTPISNAAQKVNDTYLKANNQEDGVKSYGRMVDLLLAEYVNRQNN